MNVVDRYFTKLISIICIVLMGAMSLLVITSVILRYVFSISFIWSEELITFLFLATTYFGVPLGVRYNEHIKIDFLTEKFGPRMSIVSNTINSVIIAIVQIIVFYSSLNWIKAVGNVLSPGLRLPVKYIYSLMPLSCILTCFYLIYSIYYDISQFKKNQSEKIVEGL